MELGADRQVPRGTAAECGRRTTRHERTDPGFAEDADSPRTCLAQGKPFGHMCRADGSRVNGQLGLRHSLPDVPGAGRGDILNKHASPRFDADAETSHHLSLGLKPGTVRFVACIYPVALGTAVGGGNDFRAVPVTLRVEVSGLDDSYPQFEEEGVQSF